MPVYWLGIMALVLAIALAVWITLVLRADRQIPDKPRASPPPREIVGGIFQAWRGGRQVMPDPYEPIVHDSRGAEAEPRAPGGTASAEHFSDAKVPEQRKEGLPEQSQASGDRT
jgi:hypothetical protein